MQALAPSEVPVFWSIIGAIAAIIFYGRFYVQWIVSEIRKKSVVPVAFWYMSSIGSLMLLVYGVVIASAIGTLGHSFNIVIYSRNLIHIWKEKGTLSRGRNIAVHAFVGCVILGALLAMLWTWWNVYEQTKTVEAAAAQKKVFWIIIGALGQAFFVLRFLVQWLTTELKKKSVVPVSFWYLSLVAASLQLASFSYQHEWIYAVGMASTLFIYFRNLWLIYAERKNEADS